FLAKAGLGRGNRVLAGGARAQPRLAARRAK
ncbi:inositol monophosphatase, partial [Klebsiella pneumoniae]|nr:inositol monophosphatase [Klebsiella pneumoniae]